MGHLGQSPDPTWKKHNNDINHEKITVGLLIAAAVVVAW